MATAAQKRREKKRSRRRRRIERAGNPPQGQRPSFRAGDSFGKVRQTLRGIAAMSGEWAGIPMPLDHARLVVEPNYPYAKGLESIAPSLPMYERPNDDGEDYGKWKVRNRFWSVRKSSTIVVMEKPDGSITWGIDPGIHHLGHDLSTLGCAEAWGFEQEAKALKLLESMVRPHKFKQYVMTGMFMDKSDRSGVIYLFRRLKPTVAMTPHRPDGRMGILAALCMHPIAYYEGSWGGSMTPTDDVVAHLALMRGDEAMFWRRSNQHPPHRPEAGL
jgi:hypothetical protein